jgi:uncharacterized OB-fold protein
LASSASATLILTLLALIQASTMLANAQQQTTYVLVTIQTDPPECVTRVAVFSQTRNMPVAVSKTGAGTWVSEPVPKGEWLVVAYEQGRDCANYVVVNEATLEKIYNVDRIAVYANYNLTVTVKAAKQAVTGPTQPPPPPEQPQTALLQQIYQALLTAAPTIAPIIAVTAIGYGAYRVLRTAVERSRERESKTYALRRAAAFLAESSRNPIITRGWIWMHIDPAAEIAGGHDNDRKVAAYLKLARVLPAGEDRMRMLEDEAVGIYEGYAMPAVVGQRKQYAGVENIGETLIRYAVELARDDPEIDRAIARLEKAGVDPYTIPRDLAGIDELIKRYRGVPMEKLGFRYADEDGGRFEKCPHCGGETLKGSKYCTACGAELRQRTGLSLPKIRPRKAEYEPVMGVTCPTCGATLLPGAKYCHKCGSPSNAVRKTPKPAEAPHEPRPVNENVPVNIVSKTTSAPPTRPEKTTPDHTTPAEVPTPAKAPTYTQAGIITRQPRHEEEVMETPAPEKTKRIEKPQEAVETSTPPPKTIRQAEQLRLPPMPEQRTPPQAEHGPVKHPQPSGTPTPISAQPTTPVPEELVGEEEVEWEPDEDLMDSLKAMRVDPGEFKHEAVRLAASNLDERSFEKELFRTADRLVSKIEGLRPDSSDADALRLSLFKHLMGAAQEIRKLMRPPEPPRKAAAKTAAPQPEQVGRLEPSRNAPEIPPSPAPPTQPRTTVTPPAQPKPAIQHIEPENLQPLVPQPKAQATPTIQQTPKPETTQQETVDEYIPYESVLRGEFREKTVVLLPIKRSALPTGLIAGMAGVLNLEGATKLPIRGAIAQTRTTYRANYTKPVRPSPSHPYIKRVTKAVSSGHGAVWIITEEMYSMDEVRKEFEDKGYRPVKARLDIEGSRKRLEKIMHPKHAEKLAFAGALIPWLADELETHGWEGVYKKLVELLGKEDGEEVYVTLTEALKEKPEYPNKPLAASLGVLDEGE